MRARYPFADSAVIVDSVRYDLAGNLRFSWTRRGYVIEHRYDGRNRDTLTIVPTVGTYRRSFGGPNDELTRLWIENYGDSIGGVNPELRWAHSQAGLLLADTAQGNRVTTYAYDQYLRATQTVDVAGTWMYRYDAVRGVLDTVITPFVDTLRWTHDARWRAVGPYIGNGTNPDYSAVPSWDQVGKLTSFVTTHSVQVGRWELVDSSEPKVPELTLRPTWTEQQGVGGPTTTAEDTLGHDGWGRVTSARYLKNGGTLLTEEYRFDRDANISLTSELRTYDLATTRMTASPSGTYSYDRAGNLVTWVAAGGVTWTYGYDALERLIWVRKDGALMARYAYDVLGRRIVKRVYSGPNAGYGRMIYAGDAVRAEADSAGTLTLAYTWGLGVDNLVAIRRYSDGGHWYVVQDLLRSTRGITRRDGMWLASWRYGIYGQVIDSAGSAPLAVRYRWTGREFDQETGFYYFRARYYDPGSQRFIQEDPIGYAGGLNLYGYGNGNPTNGRDPSGLGWDCDVAACGFDPNDGVRSCWSCRSSDGGSDDEGFWGELDAFTVYVDAVFAAFQAAQEAQQHGGIVEVHSVGNDVVIAYADGTREQRSGGTAAGAIPCPQCVVALARLGIAAAAASPGLMKAIHYVHRHAQRVQVAWERVNGLVQARWEVVGKEAGSFVQWFKGLDLSGNTVWLYKIPWHRGVQQPIDWYVGGP